MYFDLIYVFAYHIIIGKKTKKKHAITADPLLQKKRPNRQSKLYIISRKAKTSKTTRRICILGYLRIVAIADKSKF